MSNYLHLQLSVVIVNFNVKYFLEQCLHSVLKASAGITCEIFVIDNNSSDGSQAYLSTKFPGVIFKWNPTNDGFGKASNSVLPEVKGSHILFLNPDTLVPEDCFQKCLAFFAQNKNCGALGVRMIDGAGKFLKESKRGFPSPAASLFKLAGLAKLFPTSKQFAQYYAGHLAEKSTSEVEVLAGAFMMLSKKAIEATAGFDEDFFMYGEDIDLSYRVTKAGLANFYFPETTILHFKGESTQKKSDNYTAHFYGAMELFISKHYKENKKKQQLMRVAIRANKWYAERMSGGSARPAMNQPMPHTAVAARQPAFNDCVTLLKHADPPVLLVGRIAIDNIESQPSLGHLGDLKKILRDDKIDQLILCVGAISFKEAIRITETCGSKTTFLFHADGSHGMVGSNDKNSRGIFIAKP